ncbi:LexA/Signal peptidase [Xylariaceae sp. FL0016]|nr:LexA/Signal peptidase [Xylariaceae sp. FL0016]
MPFLGHPFRVLLASLQGLAAVHVFWTHQYSLGAGWGPSMLPTFCTVGEWYVTDKRFRRGRGVRVGDCVSYAIPYEPTEDGVKRVIGVAGDYVLLNSPDVTPLPGTAAAAAAAQRGNMLQVPKGHVYIVGDNLPWSRDSRDFGPIPMALIKGKIIAHASLEGWNPFNWFSRIDSGLQGPLSSSSGTLSQSIGRSDN